MASVQPDSAALSAMNIGSGTSVPAASATQPQSQDQRTKPVERVSASAPIATQHAFTAETSATHLTFEQMLADVRVYLQQHKSLHFLEDPDEVRLVVRRLCGTLTRAQASATFDEHSTFLRAFKELKESSEWTAAASKHLDEVLAIDHSLIKLNTNNETYSTMAKHQISFSMYHLVETLRLTVNIDIDEGKPRNMSALVKGSVGPSARNAWRDRATLQNIRTVDSGIRKLVKMDGSVTVSAKKRDDQLAKVGKRAFLRSLWADKTGPTTSTSATPASVPATLSEFETKPNKASRSDSAMMSAMLAFRKVQKKLDGSSSKKEAAEMSGGKMVKIQEEKEEKQEKKNKGKSKAPKVKFGGEGHGEESHATEEHSEEEESSSEGSASDSSDGEDFDFE